MRVGYDEQIMFRQRRGGISRYVVHLIDAFRTHEELDVDPIAGWRWSDNAHAIEAGLARPIRGLNGKASSGRLKRRAYYLANADRRWKARRADVLHHTYYDARFLKSGFRGLRVTTVYDMIPELFPEMFENGNPHLAKKHFVSNSDVLLCISESTRKDLISVYGNPGVPMFVTYLGVDARFRPGLPSPKSLPDRYLLFVGGRSGYKDFDVLAEALASLSADGTALVVVGGPFSEAECERLRRLCLENRVRNIEASDAELPCIYAGALAFVFPSRYEGFGLPTLEAMASGIPVVLARSSSHPEVGGEIARYFAPGDVAGLAAVLRELLGDDGLRDTLGQLGVARAAQFTWHATAEATSTAYYSAWQRT